MAFSLLTSGGPRCFRSPKRVSAWCLAHQTRGKHEYAPRIVPPRKQHKGRVPVRTGGSIKGSTMVFGKFGIRLKSEGVRLHAFQLKEADNYLMKCLRPLKGKLIRRLQTNIAVCVKGNEVRMGKGKGAFDHWAVRVPTGKVIFEVRGDQVHETVARKILRVASDKLPGLYEFIKHGAAPRVGLSLDTVPQPKPVKANENRPPRPGPTKVYARYYRSQHPGIVQYLRR